MTDYKVNFKDLKAKVGIDDVAYALGYRLDRKAGVGRYMELVLGDGKEKRDALVICHPPGQGFPAVLPPRRFQGGCSYTHPGEPECLQRIGQG